MDREEVRQPAHKVERENTTAIYGIFFTMRKITVVTIYRFFCSSVQLHLKACLFNTSLKDCNDILIFMC